MHFVKLLLGSKPDAGLLWIAVEETNKKIPGFSFFFWEYVYFLATPCYISIVLCFLSLESSAIQLIALFSLGHKAYSWTRLSNLTNSHDSSEEVIDFHLAKWLPFSKLSNLSCVCECVCVCESVAGWDLLSIVMWSSYPIKISHTWILTFVALLWFNPPVLYGLSVSGWGFCVSFSILISKLCCSSHLLLSTTYSPETQWQFCL